MANVFYSTFRDLFKVDSGGSWRGAQGNRAAHLPCSNHCALCTLRVWDGGRRGNVRANAGALGAV